MHHDLQVELVQRVLAHLEKRTTDSADASSRLAVSAYTDEPRYHREVARLFREHPVAVGHVSQIPNPGDFFTHDATGVPLIISRDDDGKLAAFLNVCRHRGTRLENAPSGNRKAFMCPYHAWTYGRDGQLLGVPHEHGFAGLPRAERGLVRAQIGEAAGLIFVQPTPSDTPLALDAWLAPFATELAGFDSTTSVVYAPQVQHKALNWKLAIDIFLEAYHFKIAHKNSIYPFFIDNVSVLDFVGPHQRLVVPKRSIRELANQPDSTWSLRHHANILYYLFPNTLILIQPDHMSVSHIWPDGPSRSVLTSYTLVPEAPATAKARAYWDANNRILYNATDEDYALGESIQAGLTSGANTEVVFGAFEHGLDRFHAEVARRLEP